MEIEERRQPFPHWVINGLVPEELLAPAAEEIPPASDPGWVRYSNDCEKKRAFNRRDGLTRSGRELFDHLNAIRPMALGLPFPTLSFDPSLHGGGWHVCDAGGFLAPHVDYALHPVNGLERRCNLILFANRGWNDGWGGALELFGPWGATRIYPRWNRAVLFDPTEAPGEELRLHGTQPVSEMANCSRITAAVYFLAEPRPLAPRRLRAMFLPSR